MDRTERLKAAEVFNAASDHFDDPALSFWNRFGERTIDRLGLRTGERVLDVCCGSGASALPAAARVGPSGRVLGVDLSDRLLDLCRAKARERGLSNVEARPGDMEHLDLPKESFDAVVCVFGLFFAADMTRAASDLWGLVRPGGRIAITVWGPRMFEPASGAFWEAVNSVRPDLRRAYQPWERVLDAEVLSHILRAARLPPPTVASEAGRHPIQSPEDWWTIVLGTGLRSTVDQLGPLVAERVRLANLSWLTSHDVHEIEVNVIYATAIKNTETALGGVP
jgi:ubiquinone/menaquinone biosynthesis C-methylase UbiE